MIMTGESGFLEAVQARISPEDQPDFFLTNHHELKTDYVSLSLSLHHHHSKHIQIKSE